MYIKQEQNQDVWMPKGGGIKKKVVLPSFQSLCKPIDTTTTTTTTRNHARTVSAPLRMPSYQDKQRLSLDVLVDAIELDQTMYETYKQERFKVMARHSPYDRRRSRSAPGGSMTPRWRTPMRSSDGSSMQQLAEAIVRQHIEQAKKK
ncbi:hypothetical protein K492DRAFT_182264 [Lichtheimia hyalospora FSU 10163]|nr:hypothetical protein K492DRAFT_182264 [Lichtheimia hyalospora FSU 10163]